MVLDDYSTKMISNFCTMFDLMEAGNIYQTEKLTKVRKRYPMSDAIYFVQPTQGSINKIIEDFPEEDKLDYDQYGSVHLCFLTPVPDE
jgi:syntaxin-binding protein 1